MKDKTMDSMRCRQMLRSQIDLLCRLQATQEIVKTAVLNREWEGFESLVARMDDYAQEYQSMQAEHRRNYSLLGFNLGVGSFYQFIGRFSAQERRELSELYRKLKIEALRVKLLNDNLAAYIQQARLTLTSFLDVAFPDRRGRLYSNRGKSRQSDMTSLVLDRSF